MLRLLLLLLLAVSFSGTPALAGNDDAFISLFDGTPEASKPEKRRPKTMMRTAFSLSLISKAKKG
ncbi:MAG: hypothetical protein ACLU99_03350 [Alphaproteobacteria bacterium]